MRILFCLIILFFLLTCGQTNESAISDDKKLVLQEVSDTMFFHDSIKRYPVWYDYVSDEIIFRNKQDSVYEYYNLHSKQLILVGRIDAKYWEYAANPFDEYIVFNGNEITFMYDTLYNFTGPMLTWDLEKQEMQREIFVDFEIGADSIAMTFDKAFPPFIDLENQVIYARGFNYLNYNQRKHTYDTELLVRYDIQTGKKEMIPFKYPALYETLNSCPNQARVFSCNRGDSIVISYAVAPEIDIYDISEDKFSRQIVSHEHFDSLAGNDPEISKNFDLCKQGGITEFFFGPMKYNASQDLFYRTYREKVNLMNPDSSFNTPSNKPMGIQVLDSELNLLGDFLIGEMPQWEEVFEFYPTQNGLMRSTGSLDTIILYHYHFVYE